MPRTSTHEPGTPAWVDLGSPDPPAAARFYGHLFGWEAQDQGPDAGGYHMFVRDGLPVAGLGPLTDTSQPPAWSTYVSVEDADGTAAAASRAGGTVLLEPTDVLDAGRMAVLVDTVGAAISVWQPGRHTGAQVVNEPGSLCWTELACRDVEAATAFYAQVFGWEGHTRPYDGSTYTEWMVDGSPVAGMIEMDDTWPGDVPPHWMVYFAVEDADDAAARAADLGGTVSVPPTDIPPGRFAVLTDPHGAVFSIIRLAEGS